MAIHVVNEARRCLHCKKPMCREGCPISTNIPEAIELFRTGHKEEAGEMLYPLSVICSLVCDHEKQCEGHCVLGRKGAPVHFSSIENYISDAYLDHLEPEMEPKKGQRVAIIGSGPAGITISVLLARRGYDVTIFESREKIGGVLRYGIPEFRLPKSILDRYQKQLIKLGIKIRPNTAIGRTLTVDDLQRDGYEAIFIGTGVWKPKAMGIPGESLVFRRLYDASPKNAVGMFRVGAARWQGNADAAMHVAEAELAAALTGEDGGKDSLDPATLSLSTERLTQDYPRHATSLLNLVKNAEESMRALHPAE